MAASGKDGIQGFREHRPAHADGPAPSDLSGIDALIAVRPEFPGARIIMLTAFNGDVDIQRALGGGRRWIPAQEHASQGFAGGYPQGSIREEERSAGSGRAAALHLGGDGQSSRQHIMEKLGAGDRTQAMAIAARRGIIQIAVLAGNWRSPVRPLQNNYRIDGPTAAR